MSRPSLVALLADGAWHSGPVLARQIGVTRAAISARIADLRVCGLDIYSVAGRGYRLRQPLELLDAERIRAALPPATAARLDAIDVCERTDSTNAEIARAGNGSSRACFAEYQSAGRGRAQRPWASPFGANLYLSVGRNVDTPRAVIGTLGLAVGARLAQSLVAAGAEAIGLKWPNDLWGGERKLGGILIEHRGEVGGSARLIIGIGINVSMHAEQAGTVDQPWTRLVDHMPKPPARNMLAARALAAADEALVDFETEDFAVFREQWAQYDVTRDRSVRVIEAAGERRGIARGIATDGALRVEIDGAVVPVYAGDVSLRLSP